MLTSALTNKVQTGSRCPPKRTCMMAYDHQNVSVGMSHDQVRGAGVKFATNKTGRCCPKLPAFQGILRYVLHRASVALVDVGDSISSKSTSEVGRSRRVLCEVQWVASKTAQASHSTAIPIEYSAARKMAEKPASV